MLYVLAAMFGIFFTIRKLDVSRREASEFPHVEPGAFAAWRRQEGRAYTIGSCACFLYVVLDQLNLRFFFTAYPRWGQIVGAALFVGWLGAVASTLVGGSRGRRRRRELNIVLL